MQNAEKDIPAHPPRDLYVVLQDHLEKDELLQEFWTEVTTIPPWVDWAQIQRGTRCVSTDMEEHVLLVLRTRVCSEAWGAARVVENTSPDWRLLDESRPEQDVLRLHSISYSVQSPLESIQPGGDGFASTVRVRLLHAAVRQRILKLAETKPEYYDVENWGIPINDLDCLGTIATFSATLIWLSFTTTGYHYAAARNHRLHRSVAVYRLCRRVPYRIFLQLPRDAKRFDRGAITIRDQAYRNL